MVSCRYRLQSCPFINAPHTWPAIEVLWACLPSAWAHGTLTRRSALNAGGPPGGSRPGGHGLNSADVGQADDVRCLNSRWCCATGGFNTWKKMTWCFNTDVLFQSLSSDDTLRPPISLLLLFLSSCGCFVLVFSYGNTTSVPSPWGWPFLWPRQCSERVLGKRALILWTLIKYRYNEWWYVIIYDNIW